MPIPLRRAAALRSRLLAWWDAGHRALPWRFPQHGADPYRVWLAEVMLQQTRVAVVVPYYRRFVARFPTLPALSTASDDEVLGVWSGLGYYGRARRLRAAAREALARHGGLPASLEALAALPGFGRYTAGAVASIAFALPVPCVDGNVTRVLSRVFAVEGSPGEAATSERLWGLAAALVPRERPGDFNQALMELGATLCGKHAPACARCPVVRLCLARRAGRERELPVARTRAVPKRIDVACAVVRRGEAMLLVRRPAEGLFGGLWELPSVVVRRSEDPRAALRRELEERLALRVDPGAGVATLDRTLTHLRLRLTAYRCRARTLPQPADGVRLATPEQLAEGAISSAMRLLIDALP